MELNMGKRKSRYETKPTKYKPEEHIPLLYKLFAEGKSFAAYCAAADIVSATFYNWLNQHPEFNEAYEKATLKAEVYWEEFGVNNMMQPGFNYSWWSSLMRNRFGYTEHRKLKIKDIDVAHTANDKYNLVLKAVAQGELTGHELKQVSETILTGAKINEATSIVQQVEELVQQVQQLRG